MHTTTTGTLQASAVAGTGGTKIGSLAWHRQRTRIDDLAIARRHGKIMRAIRRELGRRAGRS